MTWRHAIGYFRKYHTDYDGPYLSHLIAPELYPFTSSMESSVYKGPAGIDPAHTDVYAFGTYTGGSLVEIVESFNTIRCPMRKFFGFDSFEGMPEETDEEHVYEAQPYWRKGNYDSREHFGVSTVEDSMVKTRELVEPHMSKESELVLIPGFFENVLDDECTKKYDMRPAAYIDVDVDIYASSKTVLEFVFANNIAVEGTSIGLDDWGGAPGWETMSDGQSRAFREVGLKYNVVFEQLMAVGTAFPHIQVLARVKSVGGRV